MISRRGVLSVGDSAHQQRCIQGLPEDPVGNEKYTEYPGIGLRKDRGISSVAPHAEMGETFNSSTVDKNRKGTSEKWTHSWVIPFLSWKTALLFET